MGIPRTISESNISKAQKLKKKVQDGIQNPGSQGVPFILTMTWYSIVLPPIQNLASGLKTFFMKRTIDEDMLENLQENKVINWCRTMKKLYPIKTSGDGNCLLHAVSLSMWGIDDSKLLLRRLIYTALVGDIGNNSLKQRWRREAMLEHSNVPEGGLRLESKEWDTEWESIVKRAEDKSCAASREGLPFESLEEIHIFVLANVLRRPIILLAESVLRSLEGSTLGPNNFSGIYLPLLWDSKDCFKTPIVLGYYMNHFAPLVSTVPSTGRAGNTDIDPDNALPLLTFGMEPLKLHFLTEREEKNAHKHLYGYLKCTELNFTTSQSIQLILSAKMEYKKVPEELNLVQDYYQTLERAYMNGTENFNSDENVKRHSKNIGAVWSPSFPSDRDTALVLDLQTGSNHTPEQASASTGRSSTKCIVCRNFYPKLGSELCSKCNEERLLKQMASPREIEPTAPLLSITSSHEAPFDPTVPNLPNNSTPEYLASMTGERCKHLNCHYNASKHTHPYCHEHCEDQMGATGTSPPARPASRDISLVDSLCRIPDCQYNASSTTYPYCHEHAHLGPLDGNRCLERSASQEQVASPPARERRDTGGKYSKSTDYVTSEIRCVVIGCNFFGTEENNGRCSQHAGAKRAGSTDTRRRSSQEDIYSMSRQVSSPRGTLLRSSGESGSGSSLGLPDDFVINGIPQTQRTKDKTPSVTASTARTAELLARQEEDSMLIIEKLPNQEDSIPRHYAVSYTECCTPGCTRAVTKKNDFTLCSTCLVKNYRSGQIDIGNKKEDNDIRFPIQESLPPGNETFMNSEHGLGTPSAELMQTCSTEGCAEICSRDAGYCSRCIMNPERRNRNQTNSEHVAGLGTPSANLMQTCSAEGCTEICSRDAGYCSRCLMNPERRNRNQMSNQDISQPPVRPSPTLRHEETNEGTILSVPPRSLSSYDRHTRSLEQCRRSSCNNIGYSDTRGFCKDCFKVQQEPASRHTAPLVASGRARQRNAYEVVKCKTPGCDLYGSLDNDSLCTRCEQKRLDEENAQRGSIRNQRYVIPQERAAVRAQQCLYRECDRYGDPNFDGFCSNCFQKLQKNFKIQKTPQTNIQGSISYANPSEKRDEFKKTMQEVEQGAKKSLRRCKNTACGNMGNDKSRGYCNACYKSITGKY